MLRLTADATRPTTPFSRPAGAGARDTNGRARLTVPRPGPVEDVHLLSIINTESARFAPGAVVRVLDAGCGDGRLLAYLAQALRIFHPHLRYELYGLDVHERPGDDAGATLQTLSRQVTDVAWTDRVVRIAPEAEWPYPDGFFDVVVSQQLGGRLRDHAQCFGQVARCLAPGGFAVLVFPLKHVVMERRVGVPYAHRIADYDLLRGFLLLCNRLGIGSARRKALGTRVPLPEYCARRAEDVLRHSRYVSHRDVLALATARGLLASLRYTRDLYLQRLRRRRAQPSLYEYARTRSVLIDWLLVFPLRYVSGVTVLLEKGHPRRARCQDGV
jgi:SAM-dependent methyltransferase